MIFDSPLLLSELCSDDVDVIGNRDTPIKGLGVLGDVPNGSLCFAEAMWIFEELLSTHCSAILIRRNDDAAIHKRRRTDVAICIADNPSAVFDSILRRMVTRQPFDELAVTTGNRANCVISLNSNVADSALIGSDCVISAGAYIGDNVILGNRVHVLPNAVILHGCVIGDDVEVGPLSVIGAEANWYYKKDKKLFSFRSGGRVVIHAHVIIGAGVCVARGLTGDTIIGEYAKVGNLVQIAHEARIGANTLLLAQSGIGGHAVIGPNCRIGAQSGVARRVEVANGFVLAAKSALTRSVRDVQESYFGIPALPRSIYVERDQAIRKLTRTPTHASRSKVGVVSFLPDRVKEIVCEELTLEIESIDPFVRLQELGADSLDIEAVIDALEEEFDVDLEEGLVGGQSRIWQVVQCVARSTVEPSMTGASMKIQFRQTVQVFLPDSEFIPRTELRADHGQSDSRIAELLGRLEGILGVRTTVCDVRKVRTVSDLYRIIRRAQRGRST